MSITVEIVEGQRLLARVRELVCEPHVRHLIIRNQQGEEIIELPVLEQAVGETIAPTIAAVAAVAAVLPSGTIEIFREPEQVRAVAVGYPAEDEVLEAAIDIVAPVFER